MSEDERNYLKLIGKNQEDLNVMSAYLQDSILIVKDMIFLKKNRTFIMMVNRFMWEDVEKGAFRKNKRIKCAIKFEEVTLENVLLKFLLIKKSTLKFCK